MAGQGECCTQFKLGWIAFHSLTFQLKHLDFQSNQYKKLAPVLSCFCNWLWNHVNEKLSRIRVKFSWLMPTAVKKFPTRPFQILILDQQRSRSNYQRFDNKRRNGKKRGGSKSFNSCVRRDQFKQFSYWTEFLQSLCLWAWFILSLKLLFQRAKTYQPFLIYSTRST